MKNNTRFFIHLANFICSFFPMRREILLESHPDLSCNTYELYKLFLKKKVNKKFRITWLVNNPQQFSSIDEENVSFTQICPTSSFRKVLLYLRCNRAKVVITGNRHIQKYRVSKRQLNINIEHGSPIKDCSNEYKVFSCDYIITQSPFFTSFTRKQYGLSDSQIIPLGLPRNDQLFLQYQSMERVFPDYKTFDSVICWMPTFREHFDGKRVDCSFGFPLGIPIIYDEDSLKQTNDFLRSKNALIIIKPHPAQDITRIKKHDLSNIRVIYNSDLERNGIQTNEFLAQTDALITDYSGVYFDYLLLDQPIAITLDDYNNYCSEKGFVYDDFKSVVVGNYVYSLSDLHAFIEMVCTREDLLFEERKRIKIETNVEPFNKATERLFHFINQQIKLT